MVLHIVGLILVLFRFFELWVWVATNYDPSKSEEKRSRTDSFSGATNLSCSNNFKLFLNNERGPTTLYHLLYFRFYTSFVLLYYSTYDYFMIIYSPQSLSSLSLKHTHTHTFPKFCTHSTQSLHIYHTAVLFLFLLILMGMEIVYRWPLFK